MSDPSNWPVPVSRETFDRVAASDRWEEVDSLVPVDDSPVTAEDSMARQHGIPSNAQNVRSLAFYLKCDTPPGSTRVSSRVMNPFRMDEARVTLVAPDGDTLVVEVGRAMPRLTRRDPTAPELPHAENPYLWRADVRRTTR